MYQVEWKLRRNYEIIRSRSIEEEQRNACSHVVKNFLLKYTGA